MCALTRNSERRRFLKQLPTDRTYWSLTVTSCTIDKKNSKIDLTKGRTENTLFDFITAFIYTVEFTSYTFISTYFQLKLSPDTEFLKSN